ncbi:MAG: STAS domain-containing protein [Candidatus Bruticola sp.]
MEITTKIVPKTEVGGNEVTLALNGRFGNNSASEVESAVQEIIGSCRRLVFDFAGVDYISSAGLRVLLMAKKKLGSGVEVSVVNANEVVKEIFDISGFSKILQVQ